MLFNKAKKGGRIMELCQSPENVPLLFARWRATLIYSYLQGCMGEWYVNENDNPKSVQIVVADFVYYASILNIELVWNIHCDFSIAVPQTEEWSSLIKEVYGNQAIKK